MLPLGAIFSNLFTFGGQSLTMCVMIVVGYFLVRQFAGPAVAGAALAKLAPRAAKLLTKIESLGLPALAPVLTAVSEKRWADVPTALHNFLDQLDEKLTRRPILDGLIDTQVDDQLNTPEKRETFLAKLEKKLGVTIPRTP